MEDFLSCPIKINLVLRVFSKRSDGYHDICSLFWKKTGRERVAISPKNAGNATDLLEVTGATIKGQNIITKTLKWARECGGNIQPLVITLEKKYPPGSGIGAGSGNAAALISWLEKKLEIRYTDEQIAKLGADVAVLVQDSTLASAKGIGEKLKQLDYKPDVFWILAFPAWFSSTAVAYRELDEYRHKYEINFGNDYKNECAEIISALQNKQYIGLLPNDFLAPAAEKHKGYTEAFAEAKANGAAAWGLCGSGSALFALSYDSDTAVKIENAFKNITWVSQTERLE